MMGHEVGMSSVVGKQKFDALVFKFMILWLGIEVLLSVIRLVSPFIGVNQDAFGLLSNLSNSLVMLLALASIVMAKVFHLVSLKVVLLSCLVLIYGVFRGLGNLDSVDQYMFKHIYMVGFAVVFILFGLGGHQLALRISEFSGVYRGVFF